MQIYHWQLLVIVRTLALKDWVVSEGYLCRELMLAALHWLLVWIENIEGQEWMMAWTRPIEMIRVRKSGWSEPIWKVESSWCADGSDTECERKRRIKDGSYGFGLCSWVTWNSFLLCLRGDHFLRFSFLAFWLSCLLHIFLFLHLFLLHYHWPYLCYFLKLCFSLCFPILVTYWTWSWMHYIFVFPALISPLNSGGVFPTFYFHSSTKSTVTFPVI